MQAHKTKTKKATEQFQTKLNWFTAQLFHEADSGKKNYAFHHHKWNLFLLDCPVDWSTSNHAKRNILPCFDKH